VFLSLTLGKLKQKEQAIFALCRVLELLVRNIFVLKLWLRLKIVLSFEGWAAFILNSFWYPVEEE